MWEKEYKNIPNCQLSLSFYGQSYRAAKNLHKYEFVNHIDECSSESIWLSKDNSKLHPLLISFKIFQLSFHIYSNSLEFCSYCRLRKLSNHLWHPNLLSENSVGNWYYLIKSLNCLRSKFLCNLWISKINFRFKGMILWLCYSTLEHSK